METAYAAKVLTADGYERLAQWLRGIRRQMEDDPVVKSNFERTLYGFGCRQGAEPLIYVYDAQLMTVIDRRQAMLLAGALAAPVFAKTYWFASFDQLPEIRECYRQTLAKYQGEDYFTLLSRIKDLPGVMNRERFLEAQAQLRQEGSPEAQQAFAYYGRRFNIAI